MDMLVSVADKIVLVVWFMVRVITVTFLVYLFLWLMSWVLRRRPNMTNLLEHFQVFNTFSLTWGLVTIGNIRDWRYGCDGEVLSKNYTTRTYDIRWLVGVWFVVERLPQFPFLAHTYLSFEFRDQPPICVSVEGVRRQGQAMNFLHAALRANGIMVYFGTEEDFIIRRTLHLGNDQQMFRLHVSTHFAQQLFLNNVAYADWLQEQPKFYNTFFGNCTNTLAKMANATAPGFVRFWLTGIITGYASRALYRKGHFSKTLPYHELSKQSNITQYIREHFDVGDFSAGLRKHLKNG